MIELNRIMKLKVRIVHLLICGATFMLLSKWYYSKALESPEDQKKMVDCRLLLRGNPDYVEKVSLIKQNTDTIYTLKKLLENCSNFCLFHGYFSKPATQMELDYPIAFAIKMYDKPKQFERLLRAIYLPHNVYCIHVDAKTDNNTFELIKSISTCLPNVVLAENRINVVYATFRHLQAEVECMKACIKSNVKWKYYINLTGQEFPLKTNLELVEILKIFNGTNDIEAFKHPKHLDWRVKYKIKINEKSLSKTNESKLPLKYQIQLYKGSAYGMFSRDFVEFVLEDDVAMTIFNWLNDTSSPEENIWSTLNSLEFAPGGSGGVEIRHDKHNFVSKAVIWDWDPVKCSGKSKHSVCIYSIGDLPWLTSCPQIVANKFDEDTDSIVLDCLEEWLTNRRLSQNGDQLNWYYYRNLPHVRHNAKLKDSEKTKEFLQSKKRKWLLQQEQFLKSVTKRQNITAVKQ
ncbi:beta-1,3-galactosyl-O-glycosyl-glycoprotein beta-1,6-N-acetylglucosaminyltransferase-like [Octopus vulgaris]|uniref:Beta-1,3-galactosyl-O-glycosyl-glycoprotein beta-1,6-N-acetylglucosaminyltransferase-like n=1 Tax=Octopus vulgaris TaxID=6645 RepID=A0AA36F497_OCTVU|nr:beta-1,3-galactosyl-O-glycosyl-glycoprotein beta-1,6-N-acetylglucosaminyltransferase-like [Octopus vulgaris]